MTNAAPTQVPLNSPGFHALIVGVSEYPYVEGGIHAQPETYGLGQLTTGASSALAMYEWLDGARNQLVQPLASCRLLLSPSPAESARIPSSILAKASRATRDNFAKAAHEWRAEASNNQAGCTLFYFAGHGMQRGGLDSVLLLEDFNRPPGAVLHNAVDVNTIFEGMSPSQPACDAIAATQLYFIDACRVEPEQFRNMARVNVTPLWDLAREVRVDNRSAPIFYAALPAGTASAIPGGQSIFSLALLQALRRGAICDGNADPKMRWPVTIYALNQALRAELDNLAEAHGGQFPFFPTGIFKDAQIQFLPTAPTFDVTMEVLPDGTCDNASLVVDGDFRRDIVRTGRPIRPHPVGATLPMGHYTITVSVCPPGPPKHAVKHRESRIVAAGQTYWKLRVA